MYRTAKRRTWSVGCTRTRHRTGAPRSFREHEIAVPGGHARPLGRAGDRGHVGVGPALQQPTADSSSPCEHPRVSGAVPQMGRGVPGQPISPRRSDPGDRLNSRTGCAPLRFLPPDLDHAVRGRLAVAGGEFPRHGYGGIQVVD